MKTSSLKLGIVFIIGVVTGILFGVMHAKNTVGMSLGHMSQWAAVGTYAQLASLQYQYADEVDARLALSDFLSFTQQLRNSGNVTDPRALELSVARIYMRLAALDQCTGNAEGYQTNFSRAQYALRSAGSKEASAEVMEKVVMQRVVCAWKSGEHAPAATEAH